MVAKAFASAIALWLSKSLPPATSLYTSWSLYDFRPGNSARSNGKVSTNPTHLVLNSGRKLFSVNVLNSILMSKDLQLWATKTLLSPGTFPSHCIKSIKSAWEVTVSTSLSFRNIRLCPRTCLMQRSVISDADFSMLRDGIMYLLKVASLLYQADSCVISACWPRPVVSRSKYIFVVGILFSICIEWISQSSDSGI